MCWRRRPQKTKPEPEPEPTGLQAVQQAVHGDRVLRMSAFDAFDTKAGIVGTAALAFAALGAAALPLLAPFGIIFAGRTIWLSYQVMATRPVDYFEPTTIRKLARKEEAHALGQLLALEAKWSASLKSLNEHKSAKLKGAWRWLAATACVFLAAMFVRAAVDTVVWIGQCKSVADCLLGV